MFTTAIIALLVIQCSAAPSPQLPMTAGSRALRAVFFNPKQDLAQIREVASALPPFTTYYQRNTEEQNTNSNNEYQQTPLETTIEFVSLDDQFALNDNVEVTVGELDTPAVQRSPPVIHSQYNPYTVSKRYQPTEHPYVAALNDHSDFGIHRWNFLRRMDVDKYIPAQANMLRKEHQKPMTIFRRPWLVAANDAEDSDDSGEYNAPVAFVPAGGLFYTSS